MKMYHLLNATGKKISNVTLLKVEGHIKKNSFKSSDLAAENITFFIEKHNALKRSMKMTTVLASNKQ